MPKIKIDALEEGMVVAADVKNIDDMLLVPAGAELSARHIRILRTWGVEEVVVASSGEVEPEPDPFRQLDPEVAARMESDMRALFWQFDENSPAVKELLRLVLRRKARQLMTP